MCSVKHPHLQTRRSSSRKNLKNNRTVKKNPCPHQNPREKVHTWLAMLTRAHRLFSEGKKKNPPQPPVILPRITDVSAVNTTNSQTSYVHLTSTLPSYTAGTIQASFRPMQPLKKLYLPPSTFYTLDFSRRSSEFREKNPHIVKVSLTLSFGTQTQQPGTPSSARPV